MHKDRHRWAALCHATRVPSHTRTRLCTPFPSPAPTLTRRPLLDWIPLHPHPREGRDDSGRTKPGRKDESTSRLSTSESFPLAPPVGWLASPLALCVVRWDSCLSQKVRQELWASRKLTRRSPMCAAVSPGKRRAGEDSRNVPSPLSENCLPARRRLSLPLRRVFPL